MCHVVKKYTLKKINYQRLNFREQTDNKSLKTCFKLVKMKTPLSLCVD